MEVTIAVIALCVALWQLKLQREEMRHNSRLNTLIHIADLVREKIGHHEQIIESLKSRRSDWSGHAYRVNSELRPLLAKINLELIDSITQPNNELDIQFLRETLKQTSSPNIKTEASKTPDAATIPIRDRRAA